MKGKVARIVKDRMFGFIDGPGGEYFFHRDDYNGHWRDLEANSALKDVELEFEPHETPKGLRASNVSPVE